MFLEKKNIFVTILLVCTHKGSVFFLDINEVSNAS